MPTTLSSRDFNKHTSEAKKFAEKGPVFITNRGQPAHVLLSMKDYQRITNSSQKIAVLLAMPSADEIDFEIPKLSDVVRPADFS